MAVCFTFVERGKMKIRDEGTHWLDHPKPDRSVNGAERLQTATESDAAAQKLIVARATASHRPGSSAVWTNLDTYTHRGASCIPHASYKCNVPDWQTLWKINFLLKKKDFSELLPNCNRSETLLYTLL